MVSINTAKNIRFVPVMEEMHIYFSLRSHCNKGLLEFMDKYLPLIRKGNPRVPIKLVHSPDLELPWIWTRYEYRQQRKYNVTNLNAEQVLAVVEDLAHGGSGKYKLYDHFHYNMRLKDIEIKWRDPFTVFSKY